MDEVRELIKAYDLRNQNYCAAYLVGIIGILSVVNCVFGIFKYDFNFTVGLEVLTIFQMVLFEFVPGKNIAMASASVVLISIAVAGYMVYLATKIAEGRKNFYTTLFIIYCIDTIILFFSSEFMGVIIHGYMLWLLYGGFKSSKELVKIQGTVEKLNKILYEENEE